MKTCTHPKKKRLRSTYMLRSGNARVVEACMMCGKLRSAIQSPSETGWKGEFGKWREAS